MAVGSIPTAPTFLSFFQKIMDANIRSQIEAHIQTLGDECRPRRLAYYSVRFKIATEDGQEGFTAPLPIVNCCSASAHKEALNEMWPVVQKTVGSKVKVIGMEIKEDHIHFAGDAPVFDGEKVCDSEVLAPADAALLGIDMAGNPIPDEDDEDDEDDEEGDDWKRISD